MVLVAAWGLVETVLAVRDHGWVFSHDLLTGLSFLALGTFMLGFGGTRFPKKSDRLHPQRD